MIGDPKTKCSSLGKIGRESASRVLENEPIGSYLVRLSPKLWGYTVSVKSRSHNVVVSVLQILTNAAVFEGSRHFLVDAGSGQYSFLGPKQQRFKTLSALLEYYK